MSTLAPTPSTPSTPSTGDRRVTAGTTATGARRYATLPRIAAARVAIEIEEFARDRLAMSFIFATPLVMVLLLSSIFRGTVTHGGGVTYQQVYATGFMGYSAMGTGFQSMAISIAFDRRNRTLTRLRGLPMPPTAYFAGKIIMVLVTGLGQMLLLFGVGSVVCGLRVPTDPSRWLTFAWIYLLGAGACTLLGIAASNLIRGPGGGGAIVGLPLMILQFISGVFVVFSQLPKGVRQAASIFPLKWLCQGMRSVFLPDSYRWAEPAHSWEHERIALVLGAWFVVGLVLCLTTFRWRSTDR
jgi:ABC-2 type transport system permease protein